MPIPLIVSAAIGAGAELFGAHEASSAAKTAAQTQEAAANQALDFSKQIYQDQTQRLTPYMTLGTQALQGYQTYAQQPFSQRLASVGQPYSPTTAQGGMAGAPMAAPQGSPAGVPAAFGQAAQVAQRAYQLGPGAPASGAPMGGALGPAGPDSGGLVTIADDSGATRQVPSSQAALYQQRGFRVLA